MKKGFVTLSISMIAALLALTMATLPTQSVAASTDGITVVRTPLSQAVDQQMALTLQRERNWLMRQNLHFNQAATIAQKAQDVITKAQQAGLDVADLQNALNTFNAQVATAKTSYDQAASILSSPAGFDANGNVTDAQTAHQTLASARNALQEAHLTLANASLTLRTAYQNWRLAHNL